MGSIVPYRIDFFDTQIDSIRTFDPDTQRSLYPNNEIDIILTYANGDARRLINLLEMLINNFKSKTEGSIKVIQVVILLFLIVLMLERI